MHAQAPAKPVLVVGVAPGNPEIDAVSLRAAIGAELGDETIAAGDPRAAESVGTIDVSVDRRTHALVVAYSGPRGPITRTVDLPGDRATTERAAVLLAGNLARDEGDELAASLRKSKPAAKDDASAADAGDTRELDRLGEALARNEDASRSRKTLSTIAFATGLTGVAVGAGITFASFPKGDASMSATGQYVGAAGTGVLAFGAASLPGNFKDLHAEYLSWREYIAPREARDDLEQEWGKAAREERSQRVTTGIVLTAVGGAGLAAGIIEVVTQPDAGANRVGPWIAAAAVGAETAALGIYRIVTDGPVESALHDYERSSGRTVRPREEYARLSLRPFLAPAPGGAMAGLGGQF